MCALAQKNRGKKPQPFLRFFQDESFSAFTSQDGTFQALHQKRREQYHEPGCPSPRGASPPTWSGSLHLCSRRFRPLFTLKQLPDVIYVFFIWKYFSAALEIRAFQNGTHKLRYLQQPSQYRCISFKCKYVSHVITYVGRIGGGIKFPTASVYI